MLHSLYSSHIDNDINEGETMSNESYVQEYFTGKIYSVRSQLGLVSSGNINLLTITNPLNPPMYNSYYYFTNSFITVKAEGTNLSNVSFSLKRRESENSFSLIENKTDNSLPFEVEFNLSEFLLYKIETTEGTSSKFIEFFRYDNSITSPEISGNNVTFRFKKSGLTGSENVYIRGSFNSWNIDNNYKMEWNGTYFEKLVTITSTGKMEYKFFYNNGSDNWFFDPHNYKNQGIDYINSILEK